MSYLSYLGAIAIASVVLIFCSYSIGYSNGRTVEEQKVDNQLAEIQVLADHTQKLGREYEFKISQVNNP